MNTKNIIKLRDELTDGANTLYDLAGELEKIMVIEDCDSAETAKKLCIHDCCRCKYLSKVFTYYDDMSCLIERLFDCDSSFMPMPHYWNDEEIKLENEKLKKLKEDGIDKNFTR